MIVTTDRPTFGISLRILSGILGAGMYVSVKAVSDDVPLGEIVFFRSFFAIIPLILFLWLRKEFPRGLLTKRPFDHFLRAGFGAIAMFTSFAALARLNIAEAILISQLSPLLTAMAAVWFLSERLTVFRIGGIGLGFTGVIIFVWPELGGEHINQARLLGVLLGFASAAFTALALIMVRRLNTTESPGSIAFYFVFVSMLGALITIPWGWILPETSTLFYLMASGLFGGFAHIAMTLSFRYAEASRLAPFEYLALFWPLLADLFIFCLPISSSFIIAAPFILVGAILAASEKNKQKSVV